MQCSQGLSGHVISTSSCAGVLHFCKYLGFKNVYKPDQIHGYSMSQDRYEPSVEKLE